MERYLFEERLKKFSASIGWDIEVLRSYWQALGLLSPLQRSNMNPPALAGHLNLPEEDCLRFFLEGTKAGIFAQKWHVANPESGWILQSQSQIESLKGEALLDPFTGKLVEGDLRTNTFLTFEILPNFFDDREEAYDGSYETYRAFHFAPHCQESEVIQRIDSDKRKGFHIFTPFEFGKVPLTAAPGEIYHLYNLESHSRLVITIKGKPQRSGSSFIQKMLTYKDSKQEQPPIQTLDLELLPTGFSQETAEFQEGRIVLWIQNTLKSKVGVLVMKYNPDRALTARNNPMTVSSHLLAKDMILNPFFRENFLSHEMPDDLRLKISDLTILFVNYKNATALFDKLGDRKAHIYLQDQLRKLIGIMEGLGGFVIKTISDEAVTCFPDSLAAAKAAVQMLSALDSLPEGEKPSLKVGINSGAALMVRGSGGIDFFGHMVNLGSKLTNIAEAGEVWVSMSAFSFPGVADFLHNQGFQCIQTLVTIKGEDQKSVAYQCQPPVQEPKTVPEDSFDTIPKDVPDTEPEKPEPGTDNSPQVVLEDVSADAFFS